MSRTYRKDPDYGEGPVLEKQARIKRKLKKSRDWDDDKPKRKKSVNESIEEMIKAGSLG